MYYVNSGITYTLHCITKRQGKYSLKCVKKSEFCVVLQALYLLIAIYNFLSIQNQIHQNLYNIVI